MKSLRDLPEGIAIGIDTAPVIYLIEQHPTYGPLVEALFFERFDRGLNRAVTSIITLAEVLVHPLQQGHGDPATRYREHLCSNPRAGVGNDGAGKLPGVLQACRECIGQQLHLLGRKRRRRGVRDDDSHVTAAGNRPLELVRHHTRSGGGTAAGGRQGGGDSMTVTRERVLSVSRDADGREPRTL